MTSILIRLHCGLHTLIDDVDLQTVQEFYWGAVRTKYTRRINHYVQGRVGGRNVGLHRFLMGPAGRLDVDHVNGDGLDNRRSVNLRHVTRSENMKNRAPGDSPLSRGVLPEGVPIVALAKLPTPRGYSRAKFEAGLRA
ncbi:MAG: hypothetical protein DI570_09285 [Phenylobacterium zucineum]|nr:MAG: hypothetical protein DI570_09285 [Phenylobacterium zucineum]